MLQSTFQDKRLTTCNLVFIWFSIVVCIGCGSANLSPSQSSVNATSNTISTNASSASPVYLYVGGIDGGSGGLFGYRVDPVTAQLTPIVQSSPLPTSNVAPSVAISQGMVFDLQPNDDPGFPGIIGVYKADADNGGLTQLASTMLPAMEPLSRVSVSSSIIGPEGSTLYTFSPYDVNSFHIQPDGGIVSFGTPLTINNSPDNQLLDLAITPNGELAFGRVMIGCPSSLMSIVELRRDPGSGALTSMGQVLRGAYTPVILDPTGKYLVTTSTQPDSLNPSPAINVFAIDYATGALTQVSAAPFPSFDGLMQFDPSGKFIYETDPDLEGQDVFAFDSDTGTLTPVQTVTAPHALSVLVDQMFVFYISSSYISNSVAQQATIDVFRRDPNTGFLTSTNSSVVLTGVSNAAVLRF